MSSKPFKRSFFDLISQSVLGILVGLIFLGLQRLFWPWLTPFMFSFMIPATLVSTLMLGGVPAGLVTALTWTLFCSFPTLVDRVFPTLEQNHFDLSAWVYLATGGTMAIIWDQIKMKIREAAETSIRSEEAIRLKFAAQAARVGIWEWDISNDQLTWDDQMFSFYGIPPSEFTHTVASWLRGLHPDDYERATSTLQESVAGKSNFSLEFKVLRPDGTIRTIEARALILRDKMGNAQKMFGLNRDITEEKRILTELSELSVFFQAALDQSQAGIIIAEAPSGALKFANEAALQIRGGTRLELVEKIKAPDQYLSWNVTDLQGNPLPPKSMPLARAIELGEKTTQEVLILRDDGEKRVVFSSTSPIRRADGTILAAISVFFDTTERHHLLEELKTAREAAEAGMRAKSRFLDIAAHELRTPVTAFSLLLQYTQRQAESGHPVDLSVLKRLRAQVDRLSRLVVDLLEVSRLDRGVIQLKQEPTDLAALIQECIAQFKTQCPGREITWTSSGENTKITLDPLRIFEVLSNLIDNAIKYTPSQTPIRISLIGTNEKVSVRVQDSGPGLSKDQSKNLFQAFERGSSQGEESYSGLGLGLFICRGIIELHHGVIGVESEVGKGSTFYFELPRT